MIRVDNVSFAYPGGDLGRRLGGTSLAIGDGEWVAIAGGNGSGKTTLCRILAGLIEPSGGTVEIDGRAPFGASPSVRSETSVGIAFQDPDSQFVTATAHDEIRFGMENLGLDRIRIESRSADSLGLFDLERYAGRNPHELSGGEKQRLMLAALWSMAPRHLILDEPFSFLDEAGRRAFLAALKSSFRTEGMSVVWATVRRDEIDLADRVLFMEGGAVRFDGRPGDLDAAISKDIVYNALVPRAPDAGERSAPAGRPSPSNASIYIAMDGARFSPGGGVFTLDAPSFRLSQGECVAVQGPSGSGKTTFLLGCAGLLPPRGGTVTLFGKRIVSRRDFPAGRIAYMFQTPEQGFFAPTVREEVGLGHRRLRGRDDGGKAAARSLERVGLDPELFLDRSPFHLSEGEKRLVALASVLILEAPVLILDEPTIFLDGAARRSLLGALVRLAASGTSIIIASHDRSLMESFVDRTVILEGGRVL